ncbi:DUF4359 domain-containing protein [Cytobacillus sp. FJAT-53684]|uniref:DUF4359 domain-containing protein n=1 Tax=Cytobacillus mangrovibacter TaxID=3299024 RepID=A0ABW6K2N7_9BACI
MKKGYVLSLLILILVLFAATSNPSKSDYVAWVKEGIQEEEGFLLGMISGPLLNGYTTKKSYGVFTVFETSIDKNDEDKLVAIGLLNNFIWIKGFPEDPPK